MRRLKSRENLFPQPSKVHCKEGEEKNCEICDIGIMTQINHIVPHHFWPNLKELQLGQHEIKPNR